MRYAYEEMQGFIRTGPTLEQIVLFQHAPDIVARVNYLLTAEQLETISRREMDELREFRKADYFIHQLKLRAQRRLALAS